MGRLSSRVSKVYIYLTPYICNSGTLVPSVRDTKTTVVTHCMITATNYPLLFMFLALSKLHRRYKCQQTGKHSSATDVHDHQITMLSMPIHVVILTLRDSLPSYAFYVLGSSYFSPQPSIYDREVLPFFRLGYLVIHLCRPLPKFQLGSCFRSSFNRKLQVLSHQ